MEAGIGQNQIPVMEHFYTLQGEGFWSGTPAYFIRLAGCDVGCVWCDVKDSWKVAPSQILAIDLLVDFVRSSPCKHVVITGGEPAMYDLSALTSALKKCGLKVHIETSGVYPIRGTFDWICMSPKKFKSALIENFSLADELKIIIFNDSDFQWAESEAVKCTNPKTIFYLQPEWGKKEKFNHKITEYIKAHPRWRLSLQTHKYVDIP